MNICIYLKNGIGISLNRLMRSRNKQLPSLQTNILSVNTIYNTVTASSGFSGTTSRPFKVWNPLRQASSVQLARIPLDNFVTHGFTSWHPSSAATPVMTPTMPHSVCSKWSKSWYDHLWLFIRNRTSECQTRTSPTPDIPG